jgi:hypothetical protein
VTAPPGDRVHEPEDEEARPRDTLDDPIEAPGSPGSVRARLMQVGAFALLAASVGVVCASAAPAVARELGITEVRVVQRDFVRAAPAGQAGVDAVRDFEKGIGRSVAQLDVMEEANVPPPAESARLGFSQRDIALRASPSQRAREIGAAKKGEALVVLRQERGWALVVHPTEGDGIEVGWVPERDVQVP